MCIQNVVLVVFLLITYCNGKSYRNHALIRSVPYDFDDLMFFKTMEQTYNVTFWKGPTLVHNPVEFSISPDNLGNLYRDTETMPIRFTTIIRDIQSAFDKQKVRPYTRRNTLSFNWRGYYRLDDIYNWLRDLSDDNPDVVRLRTIGKSNEKRPILSAKLTLKGSIRRSKVIVEGGSHGCEWISPSFVTYMLHTLLHAKEYNNEDLERIALMYTWVFVPVMNPDGYEYSHTVDRLWRKNRRDWYGVDLDRNYGIAFGAHCPDKKKLESREYCGEGPFAERESYAMSLFTKHNSDDLEYYLSFHSYGQNIILPYSFTIEHLDNYDLVKMKAELAAKRMLDKHGIKYIIGNHHDISGYLVSGTSSDWVKRALNTSYVATFELPDTGVNGFALPSEQILPVCQATMDGLLVFLDPLIEQSELTFRAQNGGTQDRVHASRVILCIAFFYVISREK